MKKVILFCSIILGVSQFAYSQNDCFMKERVNKRDVVSSRNMVSGELVPTYPHYVLVVGRESDGELVYIDPYDGEAYLLDESCFENCEKIVITNIQQ